MRKRFRSFITKATAAFCSLVVQRADCHSVEPADDIDPAYGKALREAAVAGVECDGRGRTRDRAFHRFGAYTPRAPMSATTNTLVGDRRRARAIHGSLLKWYDGARRDLPWRHSRDPYAIWISETMLQQTRVETVIPYYERFLERFPDVYALASADTDDVFGQWAGLGYYSRARNLQAAAQQVVDGFAGRLPDEAEALRTLPGIGRYTAGAVASIAFDRPEPLVDGNVARVLARLLGIREDIKQSAVVQRLWEEATALVQGPRPGDFNQSLMELGATVCTPRSPQCEACPLRRRCGRPPRGRCRAASRQKPQQTAACRVRCGGLDYAPRPGARRTQTCGRTHGRAVGIAGRRLRAQGETRGSTTA